MSKNNPPFLELTPAYRFALEQPSKMSLMYVFSQVNFETSVRLGLMFGDGKRGSRLQVHII